MNTAHTPGPWEDLGLESPWGYVIKHDSGKSISYIAAYDLNEETPEPFGKWDSESIANRALVLAAPDLLAALETARETLERTNQGGGYTARESWPDTFAAIDAAIAKAVQS